MALVVEAERRGIPLLITGDDEDNLLEMVSAYGVTVSMVDHN